MAYCPNCGNVIDRDAKFCKSCGKRLKNNAGPSQGIPNVHREQCPTCHGTRSIRCERCDGFGKLRGPMFMETCPICHGSGKTRCPSC
jgi:hypothetical protein